MSVVALSSCAKSGSNPTVSSFNVINAIPGSSSIVVNLWGSPFVYSAGPTVGYASSNLFSPPTGKTSLTLTQSSDSTQTIFSGSFDFKAGSIHSFFLSGSQAKPDTLFVQDNIPSYPQTDSVTGVRFVNLASGGNPITIDVLGSAAPPLAMALAYKGITGFNQLTAVSPVTDYTFEFRDAVSDSVLTTYDLFFTPLRNQTLVIAGQNVAGAAVPLSVFEVNNF